MRGQQERQWRINRGTRRKFFLWSRVVYFGYVGVEEVVVFEIFAVSERRTGNASLSERWSYRVRAVVSKMSNCVEKDACRSYNWRTTAWWGFPRSPSEVSSVRLKCFLSPYS